MKVTVRLSPVCSPLPLSENCSLSVFCFNMSSLLVFQLFFQRLNLLLHAIEVAPHVGQVLEDGA